jgi:glycosyltransferase involved in cell wall biosynthesis
MLRVALVTGNYNYAIDGVALTTNRLVGFLEQAGVPVKVFAPTTARPLFRHTGELVSVPSVRIPQTPYRLALGLPPRIRKELHAFRPTVVHLCTPDLLGFATLRWARLHRLPTVATYHTHFTAYLKYYRIGFLEPVAWRLIRGFYHRCAEVYVAAASMADELRARGVHANFVEAPFGVDLEQFRPDRRSLHWRRSLGIPDDEVVVCFVGRLVWEKGLGVFADVLNALRAEGLRCRALVVGDGPARSGLQQRLPHAVFTGYLSAEALGTAFASADVFLNPSASETFGCVTVEALASGLAVVAADAPGSRDIVRDGVDGVLCPPEDRAAFTTAVGRLIENPAERLALGKAGIRRAASFNWDTVLAATLQSYERVIAHCPLEVATSGSSRR